MSAARGDAAGWRAPDRLAALVLAAFLALVAFTGGASRADVLSLLVLRPLAVLALGFAFWRLSWADTRVARAPLLLLVGLIAWCALQLVPLPPDIWAGLAGREMFARVYDQLGVVRPWLPLSLHPALTINSLLALLVPLAALVLAIGQSDIGRALTLKTLLSLGVISAMLGLFQILGGAGNPLYLYRVTNPSNPVGLFANRNHQAVFLAALIPLMACYLRTLPPKGANQPLWIWICAGFGVFLLPLLIATGSRAGALALVASVALTAWLLPPVAPRRVAIGPVKVDTRILAVVAIGLVVGALWLFSARTDTFSRLTDQSLSDDLRFQTVDTSLMMIQRFAPWGTGFGTFADVYQIFEPDRLTSENYLNHAHNDLLELPLEGGLPALLLMLVAIGLFAARGWRVFRQREGIGAGNAYARAGAIVLVLFLLASGFDYPLRVPLVAVLCAIMATWLWVPAGSTQRVQDQRHRKARRR